MATLVLTAVGSVVAGPIGGAIGALIGNQVDRAVLAPKGRQGPRIGDLSVQTSSYGSPLPRLFGTMRVAGTVIWATDLREDAHSSGSAKAGGKTTSYSYSASFAVALSARPIRSVGRIWADGKLLRGEAGDWKSETGFRLYLGSEDQPVDPLIASAEGIAGAPAHRGLAYAVFEGFQLSDFANRIPSLTFEVTADEDEVATGAIAVALSGGELTGGGGVALGGYAASGDSVRGAIEALAQVSPMPLADTGSALVLAPEGTTALDPALFGAAPLGTAEPARASERQGAGVLPDEVAVTYYEPARDYQAGLQRARRDGIGRLGTRIELPAAISAAIAKSLAEAALTRAWREREVMTVRLPWRLLPARAGTQVTLDGATWRVSGWTLDRMAIELQLRRMGGVTAVAAAEAGRATAGDDLAMGETRLALLDLPAVSDAATAPQVWLAAAGTSAGWRRATVSQSLDGGASWQAVGRTALPAIMGTAVGTLGDGPATLFDEVSSVEVELLNDGMTLAGADRAALIAGANLAMLGDELIQFGVLTQVGARRFRLSMLLRGRRGSEYACGSHAAGERFVLIDPARLLALEVPVSAIGATLSVMASGPGDGETAATDSLAIVGGAVRPPMPVRLTAARLGDGTVRFWWVRRSRAGWDWLDGGDAPIGEDSERYRLTIEAAGAAARTVELTGPSFDYDPAMQAADGASMPAAVAASLVQLGTRAASLPAVVGDWTL